MAVDLETAAREAVTKVQPLLQGLDEAEKECQTALGYVQAASRQLEEDRKALEQAVATLAREADELEVQLTDEATSATTALGLAATAFRQAAADGPEDLDAEAEGIENVATLLSELGPKVTEVAEAAEAASATALEQATAIGKALDETVEKIEQLVGVDLAFLVAELRQQLEVAVAGLITFMSETCAQFVDKKEAEWREKLAAVRELMETSVDKVEAHTKEVGDHAEDKWARLVDEEVTEIEAEAQTLIGELGSFTRAVENKEGQVTVAASMVEERQQQDSDAAANVERELENVRGRWGTFGITG